MELQLWSIFKSSWRKLLQLEDVLARVLTKTKFPPIEDDGKFTTLNEQSLNGRAATVNLKFK